MNHAYVTSEPGPTLQRAWQFYRWRRYAQAREEAHKFLARSPENAEAYALLALAHGAEKHKKDAKAAAGQAIRLSPDWSYPHYVKGMIHYLFDEYGEAKVALKEALRIDPADADYYDTLAACHTEKGDLKTGLKTAEAGLVHDAGHVGCHYQRAVALHALGKLGEAEEAFAGIMRLNAEHTLSQGYLGYYAVRRGEFEIALPLLRHALRDNPTWPFAQSAWQEALCGKYRLFRWVAKVQYLFERRFGRTVLCIYLFFATLMLATGAWQGWLNREGIILPLVAAAIQTLCLIVLLYFGMKLVLAVTSRALLLLDRDLRHSINWGQVLKKYWGVILIVSVLFLGLIFGSDERRAKRKLPVASTTQRGP